MRIILIILHFASRDAWCTSEQDAAAMPDTRHPNSLPAPTTVGPAVARELVRTRLKELREASELSTSEVARHTGWSISKLTRIEKGDVTVQPLEVRALLGYYGVQDQDEVNALATLSQVSRTRQWYSKHRLSGDFQRLIAYESEAEIISIWQALSFPELLQTEEYAKAITASSMRRDAGHPDVRARVTLRLDRQLAFRKRCTGDEPPHIVAAIDEAVLRRPVGGFPTLRRQLEHILDLMADESAYTLAVLPIDTVNQSGLDGTFELLQFKEPQHPNVLFAEAAAEYGTLTLNETHTKLVRGHMDDLLRYGVTGNAAVAMVRSIRESLPE